MYTPSQLRMNTNECVAGLQRFRLDEPVHFLIEAPDRHTAASPLLARRACRGSMLERNLVLWWSDQGYRDTSLIRNSAPLGPYSRTMPRTVWWSQGGGLHSACW